ncbi:MAG: hypothetical protein DHS20C05_23090 [Hyphococcus sp.]|nr:MAG: hypothetical protein DHS20C05_23090 [Marinicaulis sp.]
MTKKIDLDAIDIRILGVIQNDARISLSLLAEQVGLSVSPCSVRLRRLEKEGYILGYFARIDERRFGDFETVFAEVILVDQQDKTYKAFEKQVKGIPEILECYSVSGPTDYILKICVDGMTNYQRVVDELLEETKLIRSYNSTVSFAVIKNDLQPSAVFLDRLISNRYC